ncbi:hypothetical protein M011DRAFT_483139 [Sporormia fimetaria CBS 119925]|uniref:CENP-V/GFA domain-containing protein n=1 Tax=Sporormia fimetaria CBS 119925 TaxID=1340428 RepID=A0A6A6VMY0_9PLEO|nr:hypothetical protein M011DRAFT_483139 [Sporormia fimetaria CBS 119925]
MPLQLLSLADFMSLETDSHKEYPRTEINMRKGSCTCGAIEFHLEQEPVAMVLCDCLICRRSTGNAVSINPKVASSSVKVRRGQPLEFTMESNRGMNTTIWFCRNCSTTLWQESEQCKGYFWIQSGALRPSAKHGRHPGAQSAA